MDEWCIHVCMQGRGKIAGESKVLLYFLRTQSVTDIWSPSKAWMDMKEFTAINTFKNLWKLELKTPLLIPTVSEKKIDIQSGFF